MQRSAPIRLLDVVGERQPASLLIAATYPHRCASLGTISSVGWFN